MNDQPLDHRVRRDLRAIQGDGIAFSLMVGSGETYLPAFALAVGLGQVTAGLVAALPLLAGAVIQLVSPSVIRRLGSHKRWVVSCAVFQAATFVPLVIAAWIGRVPAVALLAIATAYWAAGLGTGPAWNTWVGAIVPHSMRARFFARRSRMAHASVLLGVVAGGVALHESQARDLVLPAFAGLFLAAGLSRAVSAGFLASQSEPPLEWEHRRPSMRELLGSGRLGHSGRYLTYLLLVQGSVYVAAPFFTPFMLGELKFSYASYLTLIATSFVAKMLSLPALGLVVERVGPQRLLYAAGLGIVPMSALWIVSQSLPYLVAVQVVGGVIWAAWELSTFLLLFERIDARDRTSVLTLFNLANALAIVTGAGAGAAILGWLGVDRRAYLVLFVVSGAARLISLPWLRQEPRAEAAGVTLMTRAVGVRPNTGSVDVPMVAGLPGGPNERSTMDAPGGRTA